MLDVQNAQFEHRFWLQVMGDHARFIRDGLSVVEEKEIIAANRYIDAFDELLAEAREGITNTDIVTLNENALRCTRKFRKFKLHLLKRHLVGKIHILLPPTFLNHMLNELDEYLRILECFCNNENPPELHAVHHHLLWLQDASGHAAIIQNNFDPVESTLVHKSCDFRKQFEAYYLKAVELSGFLRTQLAAFPALTRFNNDVDLELKLFRKFLGEIEEMRLNNEALAAIAPLLPDHMAREECYYLLKLAAATGQKTPQCDPTLPRVEP